MSRNVLLPIKPQPELVRVGGLCSPLKISRTARFLPFQERNFLSALRLPRNGKAAFRSLLCLTQAVAGNKTWLNSAGKFQMIAVFG